MPDRSPITILLSEPYSHNGEEVTQLTIRYPRGKDFKFIERTATEQIRKGSGELEVGELVISHLSGLPVEFIENLYGDDYSEVHVRAGNFMGKFDTLRKQIEEQLSQQSSENSGGAADR